MAERMHAFDLPFCVQPNAGLPRTVDGRQLYMATPEYFDVFARRMIQAGAQNRRRAAVVFGRAQHQDYIGRLRFIM